MSPSQKLRLEMAVFVPLAGPMFASYYTNAQQDVKSPSIELRHKKWMETYIRDRENKKALL